MSRTIERCIDVLMALLAAAILAAAAGGTWIIVRELGTAVARGSQ